MKYLKEILLGKKKEIEKIKKIKQDYRLSAAFAAGAGENVKEYGGHFIGNIKKGKVNIIAEIKKASPSRGIINDEIDIGKAALLYEKFKSFICGVSVLTEPIYFKGDPGNIKIVKEKIALPVLRKDFIFNEVQVYRSAEIGADCILLIGSLLGFKKLEKLYNLAVSLGMDVLVEVHTLKELRKVLDTGAKLIGINNRNLKDMRVNERLIYDFIEHSKKTGITDRIFVCESGVKNVSYIKDLFLEGVNTFLIGEYFMSAENLEKTLNDMELDFKRTNLI